MANQELNFIFRKRDGSEKNIRVTGNSVITFNPAGIVYTYENPKGEDVRVSLDINEIARLLNERNYDIYDYMQLLLNGDIVFTNIKRAIVPTITTEPVNTTLDEGDQLSLVIAGTNYNSVQWYKDDAVISGATNETYTIASTDLDDEGEYFCMLISDIVNLKSHVVTVTINEVEPPVEPQENGGE